MFTRSLFHARPSRSRWEGCSSSLLAPPAPVRQRLRRPRHRAISPPRQNLRSASPRNGGPWINYDKDTWDSAAKPFVQGNVSWPQAFYDEKVDHDTRTILTANLPTEQMTGTFPIADSDPVKQFDRNPNEIEEKPVELTLTTTPTAADDPSCVAMGAVGVLKNGVYLYNAVDASGGDAVAHETQDLCDGHPDGGDYYHHDAPSCLLEATPRPGQRSSGMPWMVSEFTSATPRRCGPTSAEGRGRYPATS